MLIELLSHFSWNKLTERFFKTSPWPEAEAISSLVGNGEWYLLIRGIRSAEVNFSLLTWACCFVCYRCSFLDPLQGAVLQAHLRQSQRECFCSSVSWNDDKSLCEYSFSLSLMWRAVNNEAFSLVQGGPTLDQRFESYYNYCNLFNYILSECKLIYMGWNSIWAIFQMFCLCFCRTNK